MDGLVNVRENPLDLVGGGAALGGLSHGGKKLLGCLPVGRLGGTEDAATVGKGKRGPVKRAFFPLKQGGHASNTANTSANFQYRFKKF
jgi:hypothetical protein